MSLPSTPTADHRPTPRPSDPDADAQLRAFVVRAARELTDGRCTDVLVLDVRGISDVTHYVLIATGTSDKQMQAVARDLSTFAKQAGYPKFGTDEDEASTWVVVDLVEAIVHLFEPATRAHYDLEMMWGDAPRVAWRQEEADLKPGPAGE